MTTFIEKKQAEAYQILCESNANLGTNDENEWIFSGDFLSKVLDEIISQTILDTIAECKKGLPEEMSIIHGRVHGPSYTAGHNTCRQAMLEHLEGLEVNNK